MATERKCTTTACRRRRQQKQAGQLARLPKPALDKLAKAADVPIAKDATKQTIIKQILTSPVGAILTAIGATLAVGGIGGVSRSSYKNIIMRVKKSCPFEENQDVAVGNENGKIQEVNIRKQTVKIKMQKGNIQVVLCDQVKSDIRNSTYKDMKTRFNNIKNIYTGVGKGGNANPFVMKNISPKTVEMLANRSGVLVTSTINQMLASVLSNIKADATHTLHNIYLNMTVNDLIERLLTKRPLVYYLSNNEFMLRDMSTGKGDLNYISKTDRGEYLHPDEAVVSSYLGVVLPSVVINNGSRNNQSVPIGNIADYPPTYVVAQVGARLEVEGSDWRTIFCTKDTSLNVFETVVVNMLNARAKKEGHSDRYRARTSIVMEALINVVKRVYKYEQNKVVLQVTGLGLGVWAGKNKHERETEFIDGILDAVERCSGVLADNVHEMQLIHMPSLNKYQRDTITKYTNLKLTTDAPFDHKINPDKHPVVSSFAWDGMSYLGNEWFLGQLTASGDPAMACATSIGYLGNPLINPGAYKRTF